MNMQYIQLYCQWMNSILYRTPKFHTAYLYLTLTIDSQCFWKMKLDSNELSSTHSVGERLNSVDAVVMPL